MEEDAIKSAVKGFILEEFLPGERPEALTDETAAGGGGRPRFSGDASPGQLSGEGVQNCARAA